MEIVAGPLDWTQIDEQRWSEFLNTETGKRVIPRMLESVPALLADGDVNAILIRSGEVRGWQECTRQLLAMSQAQPRPVESQSTAYPRLEDDAAWSDGQKLEKTPDKTE
jgi:hypothetical protein